ncbi:MAG: DNA-processing protein DprA [Clostridia bacterium]|nr:DNA-processing protein DprA [Clostridia bacterium]
MSDIRFWLWLTLKKGIGSSKITALLEHFESPEEIYSADEAEFLKVEGLSGKDVRVLADRSMHRAEVVAESCRKHGIRVLTFDSPYYPALLKTIYDPPYVLYAKCKERINLNDHMTVAVLGTRTSSPYGITMAETIAFDMARQGITVVTGMARGIDGAASVGALRGGGVPVAVLGNGLDICYPPEHKELMKQIIEHGIVLSEYPPGERPFPWNFKPRNRIITGISYGTVIVEAPQSSGAINSANWTAEQGRELFVVPGDVNRSTSQGSNRLLTEGAQPALSAEDVLCAYQDRFSDLLQQNRPTEDALKTNFPAYNGWIGKSVTPEKDPIPFSKNEKAKNQKIEAQNLSIQAAKTVPVTQPSQEKTASLTQQEKDVLALLKETPTHIDALIEQGMSPGLLAATLTTLELKGMIRALPGKQYCLQK